MAARQQPLQCPVQSAALNSTCSLRRWSPSGLSSLRTPDWRTELRRRNTGGGSSTTRKLSCCKIIRLSHTQTELYYVEIIKYNPELREPERTQDVSGKGTGRFWRREDWSRRTSGLVRLFCRVSVRLYKILTSRSEDDQILNSIFICPRNGIGWSLL